MQDSDLSEEMSRPSPQRPPTKSPRRIEIGMLKKLSRLTLAPLAMDKKLVKRTMTTISSKEAPARISWGMDFLLPYPLSMRFTMRGTTTAGDTAAMTEPSRAASSRDMPSKMGAKRR